MCIVVLFENRASNCHSGLCLRIMTTWSDIRLQDDFRVTERHDVMFANLSDGERSVKVKVTHKISGFG